MSDQKLRQMLRACYGKKNTLIQTGTIIGFLLVLSCVIPQLPVEESAPEPEDAPTEIIIPATMPYMNIDHPLNVLESCIQDPDCLDAITQNDDGSISLTLTAAQQVALISDIQDQLKALTADIAGKEGCITHLSNDYSRLSLAYDINFDERLIKTDKQEIAFLMNVRDILSSGQTEEDENSIAVYNVDTGKLIHKITFSEDRKQFNISSWPESFEGYDFVYVNQTDLEKFGITKDDAKEFLESSDLCTTITEDKENLVLILDKSQKQQLASTVQKICEDKLAEYEQNGWTLKINKSEIQLTCDWAAEEIRATRCATDILCAYLLQEEFSNIHYAGDLDKTFSDYGNIFRTGSVTETAFSVYDTNIREKDKVFTLESNDGSSISQKVNEKKQQEAEEAKEEAERLEKLEKSLGKGALVGTEIADMSYRGQAWEIDDRDLLERIVTREYGGDFYGSVLVAQAFHDAMIANDTHDVYALASAYGYLPDAPADSATQNAIDAVSYIFDLGGIGVQHRIVAYYNCDMVQSDFHESMTYVCSLFSAVGESRFFDY